MDAPAPPSARTDCPRCGYDLCGAKPPTPDTQFACPECGLNTTMRELVDRDVRALRRHLEGATERIASAAVNTSLLCLLPPKLWARIHLFVAIRRRRLLVFSAVMLVALHILNAAPAVQRVWSRGWAVPLWGPLPLAAKGLIPPPVADRTPTPEELRLLDVVIWDEGRRSSVFGGYAFMVSPPAMRGTADEWAFRIGMTLAPGEGARWASAVRGPVAAEIERVQKQRWRTSLVRAVVMPYAMVSGRMSGPPSLLPARFMVVLSLLMPLAFLALDDTFRIAKVRRLHLLRAFAYSLPPAALLLATFTVLTIADDVSSPPGWLEGTVGLNLMAVLIPASVLWFAAMWLWFVRSYLRLPSSVVVLAATTVISLLGAAVVVFGLWDPGWLVRG